MAKLVASLSLAELIALGVSSGSLAGSESTIWTAKLTAASEVPKAGRQEHGRDRLVHRGALRHLA
jgi:hypothetical protein